jgi:hypothetical protein
VGIGNTLQGLLVADSLPRIDRVLLMVAKSVVGLLVCVDKSKKALIRECVLCLADGIRLMGFG